MSETDYLAASFLGIFLIPVLYYLVEKLGSKKSPAKKSAMPAPAAH